MWDPDRRLYTTQKEHTITLDHVRRVDKNVAGALVGGAGAAALAFDGVNLPKISVTFPVMETTPAFDGSCWLSSVKQDLLSYATRQNGLIVSKKIFVEVLGANAAHTGRFIWRGAPAFRIPVGGSYALPAPDIMQELFGDGSAADVQYNFYDKDVSLTPVGTLRHQYKHFTAEIANAGAANAVTASHRSSEVFDIPSRATHRNGGLYTLRSGQFTDDTGSYTTLQRYLNSKQHISENRLDSETLSFEATGAVPGQNDINISAGGIRNVLYTKIMPNIILQGVNADINLAELVRDHALTAIAASRLAIMNAKVNGDHQTINTQQFAIANLEKDLEDAYSELEINAEIAVLADAQSNANWIVPITYSTDQSLPEGTEHSISVFKSVDTDFTGTVSFDYTAQEQATVAAGHIYTLHTEQYAMMPCSPMFYETDAAGANAGKIPAANLLARVRVSTLAPRVIMNIKTVVNNVVTIAYDFRNTLLNTTRSLLNALVIAPIYGDTQALVADTTQFVAGYSLYLPGNALNHGNNLTPPYTDRPNFGAGTTDLAIHTIWRQECKFGNRFTIPNTDFHFETAAGAVTVFHLRRIMFACPDKIAGLFFETTTADAGGRKSMFYVATPRTDVEIVHHRPSASSTTVLRLGVPQIVDANNGALIPCTAAVAEAIKGDLVAGGLAHDGKDLHMYVLPEDLTSFSAEALGTEEQAIMSNRVRSSRALSALASIFAVRS